MTEQLSDEDRQDMGLAELIRERNTLRERCKELEQERNSERDKKTALIQAVLLEGEEIGFTGALSLIKNNRAEVSRLTTELVRVKGGTWARAIQELHRARDEGNGWPTRERVVAILQAAAKEDGKNL